MYWNRAWLSVPLALLLAIPVLAQESAPARQAPIFIESDSLRIDDARGISTYLGNVVFRQGPDTLVADKVVIHSRQRQEVEKIIATGEPARFEHEPDPALGEEMSWGEALTIEYHADQALLVLIDEAVFQQGDNRFSGNRIEYESDRKLVRAGKAVAGEGRVHMIIHPRSEPPSPQDAPAP